MNLKRALQGSSYALLERGQSQIFQQASSSPTYEAVRSSEENHPEVQQIREEVKLRNIRDFFYYFQTGLCLFMLVLIGACISTLYHTFNGTLPMLEAMHQKAKFIYNNGTTPFQPTVILISLDGFRYDYLHRNLTPTLQKLSKKGTSSKYMIPSFPSITFPNHYSIVTGLLPDSHGIVGNTFYDPVINKTFDYKSRDSNIDSIWWGGEPIWITAEAQNQISAVHMWPGSEALHGSLRSTYSEPFNHDFKLEDKIKQILGWLDLSAQQRPSLIAAYIFDVDTNGHDYGPNSPETNSAIIRVDKAISRLVNGLEERNLTNIVNLMIVSDHGMAEVKKNDIIYLDDFIDMHQIMASHVFPLAGLVPKQNSDIDTIYQKLKKASKNTETWDVYKREDIPARFSYGKNLRVPPIVCIPKKGWVFSTRVKYNHLEHLESIYGIHGYDNLDPDMRAIFLAHGPYFNKGHEIKPFQNIEIYNMISNILNLKPSANNGTMKWT